jgi:hypothetical protein
MFVMRKAPPIVAEILHRIELVSRRMSSYVVHENWLIWLRVASTIFQKCGWVGLEVVAKHLLLFTVELGFPLRAGSKIHIFSSKIVFLEVLGRKTVFRTKTVLPHVAVRSSK